MLSGVGGRTIEEAKNNLSYTEAVSWMAYVRQSGPLSLSARMERGFALLATMLSRVNGGKAEIADFMPSWGPEEAPPEATPQDILSLLQAVKR